MNRIVTFIALFGLVVSIVCAAPAKKSVDTETKQIEDPKQSPQETQEDSALTNTAEDTSSKSEDKTPNEEVTGYQDIDNDRNMRKVQSEPDKRSQRTHVQKVAEHLLTQNEAITLVTELTDQDYIEQYLFNEGAQGLFEALDLLKDQGWITDIEYTIISDSIYQQMLAEEPYEIEESTSIAGSEQIAQPIYNTFSSQAESEQVADVRLADIVGTLLDRISDRQMTPEEGAEIIGAMIKILYGLEEQQVDSAYSDWTEPQQFFDLPNAKGYKQDFDIVNSEGKPIGKAEQFVETYKTDDGELGQELAALEQMEGKIGENGVFQGQQQTYQKEAIIPFGIPLSPMSESSEEGSGSSSEEETSFMDRINSLDLSKYQWLQQAQQFGGIVRK
ncbi:uncharacterized protein [Amphiura filiformis]|uniref:uncharacterized protein isoform X2 n=1 Tax=Amphiura filiformis TaxID=82378 RepID=UPI003B21E6F0